MLFSLDAHSVISDSELSSAPAKNKIGVKAGVTELEGLILQIVDIICEAKCGKQ